jgi:hypothetical protein
LRNLNWKNKTPEAKIHFLQIESPIFSFSFLLGRNAGCNL